MLFLCNSLSKLLYLSLPELILWCYCCFYWCQELRYLLVPIQSQKGSVSFGIWYHLLPSWTALLQSHVRCNSTEEICRCFYYKLSFHELCVYAGMFFGNFFHHFKIKWAVSLIIYTSGLTKNWYHALNSLQMTFPVFLPISKYQIFHYVYQLQ